MYGSVAGISSRVHSSQVAHDSAPSKQNPPASPPSLAEAAELANLHRRRKRPRSRLARTRSGLSQPLFVDQSHLADTATTTSGPSPVTPDTDVGPALQELDMDTDDDAAAGKLKRLENLAREWQRNASNQTSTRPS